MLFFILIPFVASSLLGCSQLLSPESGGAHLPNFISGIVIDPNNTPASNVDISITSFVFDENGQERVIDRKTTKTDEQGKFTFRNIENRKYIVTASKEELQTVKSHISPINNDSTPNNLFVLSRSVNIKGRVIAENPVSVSVVGTSINTQTDPNGFYTLENISTGTIFLVFGEPERVSILPVLIAPSDDTVFVRDVDISQARDNEALAAYFERVENFSGILSAVDYSAQNLPVWYEGRDFSKALALDANNEKLVPSSSPESATAFLIDDFDHAKRQYFLPSFHEITGGFWYFFTDSVDPEIPDGTSEIQGSFVIDTPIYKNSLRVEGILRENSVNNSYCGFTVAIGEGLNYSVDLSQLESISFDIKGNGELMHVEFIAISDLGEEIAFYAPFTVEEQWRRVVVGVDSFVPRENPESVWSETPFFKIQFIFGEPYIPFNSTAVVYIDNIYLNGITQEIFLNHRRIN